MSDFISSKTDKLVNGWLTNGMRPLVTQPCSVRLENTMNNTNATSLTSHRPNQESQFFKRPDRPKQAQSLFKMPDPMRNHTQTSTQSRPVQTNSQLNSTISQSSMKFLIENYRKSFVQCLESYITDFQNTTLQNEEHALLMYSALNSAICNAVSSCSSERNDVTRLGRLFAEISKKLDDMLKTSNSISFDVGRHDWPSTATSENQDPDSHSDTTEFGRAAFQSTQIDFNLDESKRRFGCKPSSSRPTTSNQSIFKEILHSKMQNKDRVHVSLKNYTSIPTDVLLGQASSAQSSDIPQFFSLSPDLSIGRHARSKSNKNLSKVGVKDTSHRKFDAVAKSHSRTPITNWTIKTHENGKVELFGCDSSKSSRKVSFGIVRSKKGNNLIQTNKGLYHLVGEIKKNKDLPHEVCQRFKNDFPRTWKKTLNESGVFNN
ncbi:uncharacterized protein LOC111047095 [Nilaparvata lugens]|uniref:uncharacterized protein LOC111047095 n=1 Tax=Nilaparvata lugens TaxID=108931 RepID=UPI00193DD2EB|nr:uncharacterized protein LOC111047095 [Nilaparvata lugens]XP_039284182.1 uncharacterized protein LOC111047095 [Nilaparvata lugens]XP_039284183.1 uncharacterized protein LOC111047095 [Nilaparvata lugens]XP_039284185.1 uncharacterized protein LOC111047095 [Nilaparvata lugens]